MGTKKERLPPKSWTKTSLLLPIEKNRGSSALSCTIYTPQVLIRKCTGFAPYRSSTLFNNNLLDLPSIAGASANAIFATPAATVNHGNPLLVKELRIFVGGSQTGGFAPARCRT